MAPRVLAQDARLTGAIDGWAPWDPSTGAPVNALLCQGLRLKGHDHYHVATVGDATVISCWSNDPTSPMGVRPGWLGQRWAEVWTIQPCAPDPRFGGRYNVVQSCTCYGEGAAIPALEAGGRTVEPYTDFLEPIADHRPGLWLPDGVYAEHIAAIDSEGLGWRDWVEGIPARHLDGTGRIHPDARG